MNKLKQLKQAIKNTPPERLAKIEYQSHLLHAIGVAVVCGVLIYKGYWWIIFAFIFSIGVTYSQGISAYQKYNTIMEIVGKKYNPKKDKSMTRKRDYIIKQTFGNYFWILIGVGSFLLTFLIIPFSTWWLKIIFTFGFILIYIFLYFYIFYWIAESLNKGVKLVSQAKLNHRRNKK